MEHGERTQGELEHHQSVLPSGHQRQGMPFQCPRGRHEGTRGNRRLHAVHLRVGCTSLSNHVHCKVRRAWMTSQGPTCGAIDRLGSWPDAWKQANVPSSDEVYMERRRNAGANPPRVGLQMPGGSGTTEEGACYGNKKELTTTSVAQILRRDTVISIFLMIDRKRSALV